MPPRSYAVVTVEKENRRYLSRFMNYQPYFTNKKEAAMSFDDRKLAHTYANRCTGYSGEKYGVVNIAYE